MEATNSASLVAWCQRLFFINSAVWFLFGGLSGVLAFQGAGATRAILAGLMLANALVMAWFGRMAATARPGFFLLAIGYMIVNMLLGIMDQVGLIDLAVLALHTGLLVLLIITRRRLLGTSAPG